MIAVVEQESSKRIVEGADDRRSTSAPPAERAHSGAVPAVSSFLPSSQSRPKVTASTEGFGPHGDPAFEKLMNDSITNGFLAAIGFGMATKMGQNPWLPGIIYSRRLEAHKLLEEAADKLREIIGRFRSGDLKQRLVSIMRPGLDGVDARSYTASFLGWKDTVTTELKKLMTSPELAHEDKQQLKRHLDELGQVVTEIQDHARTYWKHRMAKAAGPFEK